MLSAQTKDQNVVESERARDEQRVINKLALEDKRLGNYISRRLIANEFKIIYIGAKSIKDSSLNYYGSIGWMMVFS